jgi:hypothetical protein
MTAAFYALFACGLAGGLAALIRLHIESVYFD